MRPICENFWMYDVMSSYYMLIARFQGDSLSNKPWDPLPSKPRDPSPSRSRDPHQVGCIQDTLLLRLPLIYLLSLKDGNQVFFEVEMGYLGRGCYHRDRGAGRAIGSDGEVWEMRL